MELSNPYLSTEVAEAQEDVRSNPDQGQKLSGLREVKSALTQINLPS